MSRYRSTTAVVGIPPTDLVRGLEGRRAADAGAVLVELAARAGLVHAFDLPAADAVDERDRARHPALDLSSRPPVGPSGSSIRWSCGQRDDPRRPAVAVLALGRLVVVEAGRDDDRAHLDRRVSVGRASRSMPCAAGRLDTGTAAGAGTPSRWPAGRAQSPGRAGRSPCVRLRPSSNSLGTSTGQAAIADVGVDQVRVHTARRRRAA